jgi:hypothetical protein
VLVVLTGVVLGLDWATRATVTWRLESPGFSHGEGQLRKLRRKAQDFRLGSHGEGAFLRL